MIAQPGDILAFRVTAQSTLLDRMIGWGQKKIGQAPTTAAYCHAALVGSDADHMYEARWPRIHNVALDWGSLLERNTIDVFRATLMTPEQMARVMVYAKGRLGEWYDVAAILSFGLVQFGHAAVCSQYVWECFTAAGVCLCPYEDLESPDDIAGSLILTKIGSVEK